MFRYFTGLRIALLALLCACAVFAQRDLSTLAGTITDSSGGVKIVNVSSHEGVMKWVENPTEKVHRGQAFHL